MSTRTATSIAASATLGLALALTGCGSDKDSESADSASPSASPTPLDAKSARELSTRLTEAAGCKNPEFPKAKDLAKTNKQLNTSLLDITFCGDDSGKTKVAYFVAVSEEESDLDKVSDFFTKELKQSSSKTKFETEEIEGDNWQVVAIAQGELPADFDQIEEKVEAAGGE